MDETQLNLVAIEESIQFGTWKIRATTDEESAYKDADYVIIAAPTNYDPQKNFFDCSAVESVIDLVLKTSDTAIMVIKSTIPVDYTERVRKKFDTDRIIFSPDTGLMKWRKNVRDWN